MNMPNKSHFTLFFFAETHFHFIPGIVQLFEGLWPEGPAIKYKAKGSGI